MIGLDIKMHYAGPSEAIMHAIKTEDGRAAWDPNGLIPEVVRALKSALPELLVVTDVAW